MRRGLLVAHGDELYPGVGEEVEHVHESGTDYAGNMLDALLQQHLNHRFAGGHFYLSHNNLLFPFSCMNVRG